MGASITRVIGFTALHRYFRPDWSPEKNRATFGECAAEPGHAHDYRCTITVGGVIDPITGMVMDLGLLDRILADEVTGAVPRQAPQSGCGGVCLRQDDSDVRGNRRVSPFQDQATSPSRGEADPDPDRGR